MCRSINSSFQPLHLMAKFMGFAIFTLESKSLEVILTKVDVLFMTCNFIGFVLFNIVYWDTNFDVKVYNSELMKSFFPNMAYTFYLILTCAGIGSFLQRHLFAKLMKLLREVDRDLESLGFRFNYMRQRRIVILLIITINITELMLSILCHCMQIAIFEVSASFDVFIFLSWGLKLNLAVISMFLTSACGVRERQKAINKIIK